MKASLTAFIENGVVSRSEQIFRTIRVMFWDDES
jgi:hypothetical protein